MENVKPKGRPKKNDAKKEHVIIACSLVDKNKIVKAAESSGLSISSYVLKKIING